MQLILIKLNLLYYLSLLIYYLYLVWFCDVTKYVQAITKQPFTFDNSSGQHVRIEEFVFCFNAILTNMSTESEKIKYLVADTTAFINAVPLNVSK